MPTQPFVSKLLVSEARASVVLPRPFTQLLRKAHPAHQFFCYPSPSLPIEWLSEGEFLILPGWRIGCVNLGACL